MTRRRLLAGNWKMNGSRGALQEVAAIGADPGTGHDTVLFLPAPLIALAVPAASRLQIGGQDCHAAQSGAFTGGISAAMLADVGAQWVLVGHSECRRDGPLGSADVANKVTAAMPLLHVMVCVGEARRGIPPEEIVEQLVASLPPQADPSRLAIAYEPVWAIGTGDVPAPAEIDGVHRRLRDALCERFGGLGEQVRILYGGSVNAGNAREIVALKHVDGLLVGGASLTAATFLPIANVMGKVGAEAA